MALLTVDWCYAKGSNGWYRKAASCGRKRFSLERFGVLDRTLTTRLSVWILCIWCKRAERGLMLGDPGSYGSYAACPTWRYRLARWIAFRTEALPSKNRPHPEGVR